MEHTFAYLEKEYCPPIDPALFAAIVSDFDLNDSEAIKSAREILDAVKTSADEQDSTGFDPSGSASGAYVAEDEDSTKAADLSSEVATSHSNSTELTNLSNDVRSLNLATATDNELSHVSQAENLDDTSKIALLKDIFPESSEFGISHTLSKCGGNWNRALEELLNHTFFNDEKNASEVEEGIPAKGIEAFSEDQVGRRGRKKKPASHRKALKLEEEPARSSSLPNSSGVNHWDRTKLDIDFLAARTNISRKQLSHLYHQNGALLPATIIALINTIPAASRANTSDEIEQSNVSELATDFPTLPLEHVTGLVYLAHPSTAAAHELAKALTAPKGKSLMGRGSLEVIPRYAPINVEAESSLDGSGWSKSSRRTAHSSGASTPVSSSTSADPVAQANNYLTAQQRSFAQAAAAYRRGKSDHLMSGVAGYYSQQGRDFAMKRAEATAEVADALVQSQSTDGEIDLHGVSVKDAVRISKQSVQRWWRERATKVKGLDGRVRVEDGAGYGQAQSLRIVTGIGRHSAGGKGKIGPAVGRMLASEGWAFQAEDGVLTVSGKRF